MIQIRSGVLSVFAAVLVLPAAAYGQCGGGRCGGSRNNYGNSGGGSCGRPQGPAPRATGNGQQVRSCGGGNCCAGSPNDQQPEEFYRAEGCGMSYDAAKAKDLNYKCSMDGSRLVPTLKTKWGTVSLSMNPWPATHGRTNVEVRPLDRDAKPINGAEVSLKMHTSGLREKDDYKLISLRLRPNKEGLYAAPATLSMSGAWFAIVTVRLGPKFDDEVLGFHFVTSEAGSKTPVAAPKAETDSYTCPMHRDVNRTSPGACPKCGMQLVRKQ